MFGQTNQQGQKPGGLFGTQGATGTGLFGTTPASSAPGGLFSSQPPGSLFSAKPTTNSFSLTSQPATTSTSGFTKGLFGQQTTGQSGGLGLSLTSQPTSTPLLGNLLSSSTASTTTTPTPAVGSLFGTTASSASTNASSAPAAGLSFSLAKSTAPTGFSLTSSAGSTTSAASALSLNATATSGPLLGAKSTGVGLSLQPTVTASVSGPGAQSSEKDTTYKQLEDNVNKWNDDLDELERQFLAQATQINAWDRLVLENGDRITALNEEIGKIKANQDKLDQDLDFVGSQQKDLEEFIEGLESSLANSAINHPQNAADEQRRDIFDTAANVDCQLKQMTQDLREVIERINATSQPDETVVASPFGQLERILNAHVDSLNWADQNIEVLSKQVEQIQIPKISN